MAHTTELGERVDRLERELARDHELGLAMGGAARGLEVGAHRQVQQRANDRAPRAIEDACPENMRTAGDGRVRAGHGRAPPWADRSWPSPTPPHASSHSFT